jgi:LacI family transcriptional regulator
VLGFDDSDLATYTSPQLTTVRIPVEHMAANACRWLLNACFGMAHPVIHEFKPMLVWRQSVARLDEVDERRMACPDPVRAPGRDGVAFAR